MTKDNSTGKNKDFYDLGKKKFDQIRVLPEHQVIPQIPQERSSKYMTVFELIEANGLNLHGDIEHFAALVAAAEREAILDLVDSYAKNNTDLADAIRARGNT